MILSAVFTIIIIIGSPPPPNNVTMRTTQSSLSIIWTTPSQCVSYYVIGSNFSDPITTTDTSANILLHPSCYCVSMASVDSVNRMGEYSDEECIELNGLLKLTRVAIHVSDDGCYIVVCLLR